ncbi:hypothetical protein ACFORL_04800 [Legionella dresdenensis]|uniref:Coiled-coil protein n=1 Tax=Legionella dresdenensis TaxID=450200 RepID=A0ABV8CEI7_9GAMM
MTALRQQLEQVVTLDLVKGFWEKPNKKFVDLVQEHCKNEEQQIVLNRTIAVQLPLLLMQYSVIKKQLNENYKLTEALAKDQFISQLTSALMMAELLEYIYSYCVNVECEADTMRQDQEIFWRLLQQHEIKYQQLYRAKFEGRSTQSSLLFNGIFSKYVGETTGDTNWLRLIGLRFKRILNAIVPLVMEAERYRAIVKALDRVTNPVIAYIGWVFFAPRLANSLFLLGKHTIPGTWMSETEKKLGVGTRLQIQMQFRWFELGNDSVWFIAGVLNCFVWLGPHVYIGVLINAVLYGYDMLLASIRAGIEYMRLQKMLTQYREIVVDIKRLLKEAPDEETKKKLKAEKAEVKQFMALLEEREYHELKKMMVGVVNTSVLLVAIILCLPSVAVSPWIGLVGAILLLTSTITACIISKALNRKNKAYELCDELKKDIEVPDFAPIAVALSPKLSPLRLSLPALPEEPPYDTEGIRNSPRR